MDVKLKKVRREVRSRPRWVQNGRRGFMSDTWAGYTKKPRIYFGVEDENILENFAYRTTRPTTLYRSFMPEVLKRLGLPADTKVRWSPNAGCNMCPCSPGFIVDVAQGNEPWDGWVTLVGDDAKVEKVTDEVKYRAQRGVEVIVEGGI